jgi:hypothetical protein
METNPNVFFGGHAVEIAPPAGGKSHIMAHAASAGASGGSSAGLPCIYTLKVKRGSPNAHLKTKAHWVLGGIPKPADGEPEHTFYVGKKWTNNGFDRYWGFVIFGGKRYYGWIDGPNVHGKKGKSVRRLKTYAAYVASVRAVMLHAWRYLDKKHHAIPVQAKFKSSEKKLTLYRNRDSSEASTTFIHKPAKGDYFLFVRWASSKWILVGHDGWYFIKGSYKDLKFKGKGLEKTDKRPMESMTLSSIASHAIP